MLQKDANLSFTIFLGRISHRGRTSEVDAPQEATIQQVLETIGKPAPLICYHEATASEGLCRLCVVEIEGWRVLAPALRVSAGMVIFTNSKRVKRARRTILEMLNASVDLSEAPALQAQMDKCGADRERFPAAKTRAQAIQDDNPFYIRDYQKCLLCWRCVQACGNDIQFTYALTVGGRGFAGRGISATTFNRMGSLSLARRHDDTSVQTG
ncbi:MAG: 2Fe-2S iron-sulfur cluster binding domain-containing protein [SAR324 cluster bacterium]|nr:2Fe-2S iron-sulfur cluster binding domain-containing protein [SAR324 cluster bacterium]